jgi:hypothetical protein
MLKHQQQQSPLFGSQSAATHQPATTLHKGSQRQVRAIVRVRNRMGEEDSAQPLALFINPQHPQSIAVKNKLFSFDHFYDQNSETVRYYFLFQFIS